MSETLYPRHSSVSIEEIEAVLWDDAIAREARQAAQRLEAIRCDDDAAAGGEP